MKFLSRAEEQRLQRKERRRASCSCRPIANENVKGIPAADLNNARIAAYTRAMEAVAAEQKVGFANVFDATKAAHG